MSKVKRKKGIFFVSRLLCGVMLLFFVMGFIFQYQYKISPHKAIPIELVSKTIRQKSLSADKEIARLQKILEQGDTDELKWLAFEKNPFTYLVYHNKELIFWSDNQYKPTYEKQHDWEYGLLSKAHAITKSVGVGDYQIISYIPIKYNYPYENEELQNVFVEWIKLDKEIDIIIDKHIDTNSIYSSTGAYLFSLENSGEPIFNERISLFALFAFGIAFLIMFYLLAHFPYLIGQTKITSNTYIALSTLLSVVMYLLLRFSIPSTFFSNSIFTPYLYSSNTILKTLTHLSFLSIFIFSEIVLYTFYVKKKTKNINWTKVTRLINLLLPALFFLFIYYFLIGLIFNSTTEQKISDIKDFSFIVVWIHFLYLVWGVCLILLYKNTHLQAQKTYTNKEILWADGLLVFVLSVVLFMSIERYATYAIATLVIYYLTLSFSMIWAKKEDNKKTYLALWIFVFTFTFTGNAIKMNRDKKFDQYRVIAENHFLVDNTEEYRIAESLISALSLAIENDVTLHSLLKNSDSIVDANAYLNDTYFRGFWNKYELRIFTVPQDSKLQKEYEKIISTTGKNIGNSHFYSIRKINSELAFLGRFQDKETPPFYIELYPKRNFKSYSFPNLLIESKPTIQSRLELASATYQYRQLKSYNGDYNYPKKATWIKPTGKNFFKQEVGEMTHYIYSPDSYIYYVLSEKSSPALLPYLLYLFYTYLSYVGICFFSIWIDRLLKKKPFIRYRFTSKYLYSFILLVVLGFVVIFVFTLNYMETKYKDQQLQSLKQTKSYIQSYLQENYYWIEDLNQEIIQHITTDLQRLSYIYQTDIHVYDNNGDLISSSQPRIFEKKLMSRKISPISFFSQNENMDLYENIGKLEYLTSYTDFYNGDFLQLGYIAIPFFFSKDKLEKDVENFLTITVQIYLFIVILFIFLSLIIARRLSNPLTMLQENLKEIRLGKTNKKIAYKPNDEIKLLVIQYNKMVEELEKSTRLLIKSERESAWKTMARQVAHEINNPLTPMKLTIQQLQRVREVDKEQFEQLFEKYAEVLIEQIDNLTRIAATFSNFAKMPDTKLRKVDVAKKINSVIALFEQNNQDIIINYIGKLDNVFVVADKEQLVQVLNNIIKNAIQAIPNDRKGVINITLVDNKNETNIYIQDNGKGIAYENKKKMFQPSFTTKSTGMGLGLSISKNLVQNMGGKISFKSKIDKGTTFKINIPHKGQ